MLEVNLLSIGFHKGEADFRASMLVKDMTYDQMQEFRAMIPVAIRQIEELWANREKPDRLQTNAKTIDASIEPRN